MQHAPRPESRAASALVLLLRRRRLQRPRAGWLAGCPADSSLGLPVGLDKGHFLGGAGECSQHASICSSRGLPATRAAGAEASPATRALRTRGHALAPSLALQDWEPQGRLALGPAPPHGPAPQPRPAPRPRRARLRSPEHGRPRSWWPVAELSRGAGGLRGESCHFFGWGKFGVGSF